MIIQRQNANLGVMGARASKMLRMQSTKEVVIVSQSKVSASVIQMIYIQ